MELRKNEIGTYIISEKAFKDMAAIACSNVKNVYPTKKDNDFVKPAHLHFVLESVHGNFTHYGVHHFQAYLIYRQALSKKKHKFSQGCFSGDIITAQHSC